MNNLLLLGDGESWSRQTVDFAGIPEMARTFLQVAAGAADIPVTRLLGQSPSGLSATGESDVRNYYDMIAARQELDLRPQLERLDRLICWSEDIDEGALSFAFRPLWQLDEPAKAALALTRAQATQVYAGLKLWPDAVMARLAEAQLLQDGTYPNAAAVFAEAVTTARESDAAAPSAPESLNGRRVGDFYPLERRDPRGRWAAGGGAEVSADPNLILVNAEKRRREYEKELEATGQPPHDVEAEPPPDLEPQLGPASRVPSMPIGAGAPAQPGAPRARPGGSGAPNVKPPPMGGGAEPPADPEVQRPAADPGQTSSGNTLANTSLPAAPTAAGVAGSPGPQSSAPGSSPNALLTSLAKPRKLTHEETAVMKEVFREDGQPGNVSGALRLLDQIADGSFTPPEGLTKEILAIYIERAKYSIRTGRDETGVQALRLKALNMLMEQMDGK